MIILSIETSCDETSCSILQKTEDRITILSNIVASSALLQSKYGGIIPEQAAREQLKSIIPVIEEALRLAALAQDKPTIIQDIDAIAVTYGPGLIGSLLVGVETAKTLALIWNKPLIPVNHLIGHFYANWIVMGDSEREYQKSTRSEARTSIEAVSRQDPEQTIPSFPCLGLLVSGGHTDLVLFKQHGKYEYLGGTRDDAAGECFDKCARILGLPYPGGPQISKLAMEGNPKDFDLPRPMINSKDYDFSFSGLKTAVANLVNKLTPEELQTQKANLCASIEESIVDVLAQKTIAAAKKYNIEQIIIAGGVAANQHLSTTLKRLAKERLTNAKIFIPSPNLCTDNAAMIAAAAFFIKPTKDPLSIQANPNLSL